METIRQVTGVRLSDLPRLESKASGAHSRAAQELYSHSNERHLPVQLANGQERLIRMRLQFETDGKTWVVIAFYYDKDWPTLPTISQIHERRRKALAPVPTYSQNHSRLNATHVYPDVDGDNQFA